MKAYKISDNRKKWDKLLKEFSKIKTNYVTVGIHSSAVPYPSGKLVPEVAATHEFGIRVPQRSFIASTTEKRKDKIIELIKKEYDRILSLRKTTEKALSLLGLYLSTEMKNTITTSGSNIGVEWLPLFFIRKNLPRNRWTKRTSKPLIDTGRLRSSISYELHT